MIGEGFYHISTQSLFTNKVKWITHLELIFKNGSSKIEIYSSQLEFDKGVIILTTGLHKAEYNPNRMKSRMRFRRAAKLAHKIFGVIKD